MKRKIVSLWLALTLLLTCALVMPMASAAGEYDTPPNYKEWLVANYDGLIKGKDAHEMAGIAARYYKGTQDAKYLTDTETNFRAFLEQDDGTLNTIGNDFFSGIYVMEAYEVLLGANKLQSGDKERVLQYLDSFFRPSLNDTHNQIIERAVAMAWAIQYIPDAPKYNEWVEWTDKIWNKWYADKDLNEDAGDYNGLALRDVIRWAEIAGRTEQLLDPEVQKMFERYRDQVGPNGAMPEYGDDFYGRSADWIYMFEYCANLYCDPTFAYAARKMYDWAQKNGTGVSNYFLSAELFDIIDNLYTGETSLYDQGATVSKRYLPGHNEAINKVLIRPDKQAGSPYMVLDNGLTGVSHAHVNARGSIIHYEYNNVPLYHSLTRRFVDARYQNVPFLMDEETKGYYPFDSAPGNKQNPSRGRSNVWFEDTLSLQDLPAAYDDPDQREFDTLCFRLSKESHSLLYYYADNIRLEGPAGTKMLYDFESGSTEPFARNDNPFEVVDGGYESNKALKITVDDSDVFYNASQKVTFNLKEYDRITWNWKVELPDGAATNNLWSCFRLTDNDVDEALTTGIAVASGYGDVYIQLMPEEILNNRTEITNAVAENKGRDSYSEIDMVKFHTDNTTLNRRIVLTEEGYAVIADTMTVGAEADGYTGGPLFTLYNQSESGSNWFLQKGEKKWYTGADDATGQTNGMLVKYGVKQGREAGSVNPTETKHTTFVKEKLAAGTPTTFVTVLAPNLDDKKSGQELADSIVIQKDLTKDSQVSFQTDSGWVTVNITPDDWSVTRGADAFGGVKVKLNDTYMSFDQPAEQIDDRVLVPMRTIFEALGAEVEWDAATATAIGKKDGKEVRVSIDNTTAYINGEQVTLDVPARLINSKTLVPVRFVSEGLGAVVDWDEASKTVLITASVPTPTPAPTATPGPVVTGNLVSNGDIEAGSEQWSQRGVKEDCTIDSTVAKSGSQSLKIETSTDSWRGWTHSDISVVAGQTYTISAWVKTENVEALSSVYIVFGIKDASGNTIVSDNDTEIRKLLMDPQKGTHDWTKLEAEYTIPEGGAILYYLTPRVDTKSMVKQTAWFDDISVEVKGAGSSATATPAPSASATPAPSAAPTTAPSGTPSGDNVFAQGTIASVDGWTKQKASLATDEDKEREILFDANTSHDAGTGSLMFKPSIGYWRGWRSPDIPVEAGATYKISYWVKAENFPAGTNSVIRVSFGVKDAAGNWIVRDNDDTTTNLLRFRKEGTFDWTLVESEFTVPAGGAALSYFTPRVDFKEAHLAPPVTVWMDDFSVVRIK